MVKAQDRGGTDESIRVQHTRKMKSKRKNCNKDEEFEENANEARKLQEKFATKRKGKEEDSTIIKVKSWDSKPKVVNCDAHNNIVTRAEENQISKMYQIDDRTELVPTQWKCALCGHTSSHEDLGDLFGPYYIRHSNAPGFLCKKGVKNPSAEYNWMDVWFHGNCILWAPDIHMQGNQLSNLDNRLPLFWKQMCSVCHHEGASIPIGANKAVHFPCAKKKGFHMNETVFSCHTP